MTIRIETDRVTAMYGKFTAVKGVSLRFAANQVHALIGPSGCGKSTFLRTLNRMHEMSPGGWITGQAERQHHDDQHQRRGPSQAVPLPVRASGVGEHHQWQGRHRPGRVEREVLAPQRGKKERSRLAGDASHGQ